jgi:hypothetical protein
LRIGRTIGLGVLAVLAFALILLARFPAQWVVGFLPHGVTCDAVAGTLWNGACSGLLVHQQPLGDLTWMVRPARLLSGRLGAHVELSEAGSYINGDVEITPAGTVYAHNVHANVHLGPDVTPQLPGGLRGTASADLSNVEFKNGKLRDLRGHIEARDLAQTGSGRTDLGSYAIAFAGAGAAGAVIGELRDLGGPLVVDGTVRMTPEPGFQVDGKVATRSAATPNLVRELQVLGPPDAQGRRSFSVVDTF